MYGKLLLITSALFIIHTFRPNPRPIILNPLHFQQTQSTTITGSWLPTNKSHYTLLEYPSTFQPFDASTKCASGYWEASSPPPSSQKRVAIMYSGGSRSFYEVWPSQLRHLFESNPEVELDIFMATNLGVDDGKLPLFECQQFEQRQFINRVKTLRLLTLDMEALTIELKIGIDSQPPVVPNFHYQNLPQPANSKFAVILSFWLMHTVWMDFQRWTQHHNLQYDLIIRMRPDIMFYSPDNSGFVPGLHFDSIIAALEAKIGRSLTQPLTPVKYLQKMQHSEIFHLEPDPRIHLASKGNGWDGYPDQIAIMTTSIAKIFHNTLLYLDELLCPSKQGQNCNPGNPKYTFHPETIVNMTVHLSQPMEGGWMKLEELWDKEIVPKTKFPSFGSSFVSYCLFKLFNGKCMDTANKRGFQTDFPSNHAPAFYSVW